ARALLRPNDDAVVALGLQLCGYGSRLGTRWIAAHANAPERSALGLRRLHICGVTRLLQSIRECVGTFIVGKCGKLDDKTLDTSGFGSGSNRSCRSRSGGNG